MTVSILPRSLKLARKNKLENITLRGFGGGWNAVETDLQMESTYLVTSRNFKRTAGATQKVRFGTKWIVDTNIVAAGNIVDMIYFSASIICVLVSGVVVRIDNTFTPTVIWSTAIAAALPGSPTAWSGNLKTVNFVPYKNELIIHNGIDKPITVSRDHDVTYLQDLATGSNVNVPIGKYGCVVSNYHCVAGIPNVSPTLVYISAVGTAGTFPGDPAPNDSITVDVGAFAPQGAVEIRGIAGFRQNLLVFFQDQTVIVKLGTYNEAGVHEPFFPDTLPTFGLLGHRCVAPVENDLLFAGLGGMASARRNLLSVSGTLESQSLSERIAPPYQSTIGALTDEDQLNNCWMVYDALGHDMFLFTPFNGRIFVYSFSTKLRYSAWAEFSDLGFQCGCRSFLGRVFFADGSRVYQLGNPTFADENYNRDREMDRDGTWANSTFYNEGSLQFDSSLNLVFECISSHTSPATGTFTEARAAEHRWDLYEGRGKTFELELPWLDSKDPMRVKFLRFISLATKGSARFKIQAYVDNLYKNEQGEKIFGPSAEIEFIGNEAVGFGLDAGPYGGGRRSDDPRLYKFPVKFKKLKLVVIGDDAGTLEIVNMAFLFSRGKYKR